METKTNIEVKEIRKCTACGKPMKEGYCISSGEAYYCSDECLHTEYTDLQFEALYRGVLVEFGDVTEEELQKLVDEVYDEEENYNSDSYYTEWDSIFFDDYGDKE